MSRAAILILGMHRSGTSALTRLAGHLGAALPADGIAATADNAQGYWESAGLVKADDQWLRVCRSSWFDPRPLDPSRLWPDAVASRRARIREAIVAGWGDAPLLAIKDPRQCRFVPLIAGVLAEMGIEPRAALMLRAPDEIARSLAARDGTSPAYAHLLWARHMLDAERDTRAMRRVAIRYDAMLADPAAALAALAQLIDGAAEPDPTAVAASIDARLRHHAAAPPAPLEAPLAGIVAAVAGGLDAIADGAEEAGRATLDRAAATLEAVPWLTGDIVHDELRHRRVAVPAAAPVAPPERTDVAEVRASGLFDAAWYLATYPDIAATGIDPIAHYLDHGAAEGRDPSPLFRTGYYARQMARRMAAEGGR